jgi:long-subunit acyl-CoA synthetase (AMP-forming)
MQFEEPALASQWITPCAGRLYRNDAERSTTLGGEAPAGTISVERLEEMGDPGFDFEAAWRAVEPDDVLCLIYTSGTTGPPKGVQLTHANLMGSWPAANQVFTLTRGIRQISYLPSAHIADRYSCLYGQMVYGGCAYCCPDVRRMTAYSIEVRPTVWAGVPRVFEKLKAALEIGMTVEPDAEKRETTEGALEIGRRWVAAYMQGEVPGELQAEWEEADERVFARIRAMIGLDEVELFGVSAAPTPPEVIEFFLAIGIEICELWGMSEASATVSPANIEAKLKTATPLIAQAVAIGDRRPYNVALVVLDHETLAARGLSPGDPQVAAEIEQAVAAANERLSRVEQIKRHKLLEEEWVPGGEELKRRPIAAKYAVEIEALYA